MNPAALWLLLLVVVILLLPRRPSARVRRLVGNLYLWTQPVAPDPMAIAFRRLRRHRLVLLQAVFMLCVIAALARPMLSWRPRQVVVIVDVSASMGALDGGVTRLDRARAALAPVLASVPRGSRVRLMVAGALPADRGEFPADDGALMRTIGALRTSGGGADIAGAVRDARIASGADPLVIVASDRPDGSGGDARVKWITVGHPSANVAITRLDARRFPSAPDDGEALASVSNYGVDATSVEVEISQADRLVQRRTLRVEPGRAEVVVTGIANIGGVIKARILNPDALAIDNERLAIVTPRKPARVLLVGGRHFFLEEALSSHPDLAVDTAASNADADFAAHEVIVCDPCTAAAGGDAGVLLVAAGGASESRPLTISLPQHPLAAALDLRQAFASALDGPPPAADADVVLRAGGMPAVIAYERDGRRFVDLRLDLEHDRRFPLSTSFPVMVDNIIGWLARRDEALSSGLAGDPLRWRAPAGDDRIRGPDGNLLPAERTGAMMSAAGTDAPGVYASGSGRLFAVNPVTDGESDLSALPAKPLEHTAGSDAAAGPPRREIAAVLLVAALLVLAIEWWYRGRWAVQA